MAAGARCSPLQPRSHDVTQTMTVCKLYWNAPHNGSLARQQLLSCCCCMVKAFAWTAAAAHANKGMGGCRPCSVGKNAHLQQHRLEVS